MERDPVAERQIPDNFYLNEVKREIKDVIGMDMADELAIARQTMDLDVLRDFIVEGSALSPADMPSHLRSNRELRDQVWDYLNECFVDAQIRRGYNGQTDFRAFVVAHCSAIMRLARVFDDIKVREMGAEASTKFTNTMTTHYANMMAASFVSTHHEDVLESDAFFAANLANKSFEKTAIESGFTSWFWTKTHTFAEGISSSLNLLNVFRDTPDISNADAEMLRRTNEELTEASSTLKTYTIKPAVADMKTGSAQVLFVSPDISAHRIISGGQEPPTGIKIFRNVELSSSNARLTNRSAYKGKGGLSTRVEIEGLDPNTPNTELMIQYGHISLPGMTITEFGQKLGTPGKAALLQAMLLAQKFDLTVPSYIVDLANEESGRLEGDVIGDPVSDKMRALLLARIRILKTLGDDIAAEMDKEIDETNLVHKDLIRHGVVGHLRRLPSGYHAAPEARMLCMEQLGIEIPEGHTYVQIHERGNVVLDSRGHKVKKLARDAGQVGLSV